MSSPEHDVVTQAWAAITVRVAWTLRSEGVRITRDRLRDAREHVIWHLPPGESAHLAEDRAERLVRRWVAQVEGRPHRPRFPEDDDHPLPQRWRDVLFAGLPGPGRLVLWKHYADGIGLHKLDDRYDDVDRLALEAAREGLRETVREVARAEGRPIDGWADDRLDELLHRLAQVPMQPAPSLLDVVDGQKPEAVRACVRCARAWMLVSDGHVGRSDLVAPTFRPRPSGTMTVVALQLKRDVRHRRSRLRADFPSSFPLAEDILLLHAPNPGAVFQRLVERAQTSWPTRDQVRGVKLEVAGRWSASGPLGPGADEVEPALRHVPWGWIESLGELPAPLPPPPSAAPVWLGVAMLGALVFAVGRWAVHDPFPEHVTYPLVVDAVKARQGIWLDFDVDEAARIVVVGRSEDGLSVVLDGRSAADKARAATGDGRFRLHALGPEVLIASTSRPLPELPGVIDGARDEASPLDVVARAVQAVDPAADVRILPSADGRDGSAFFGP